MDTMHLTAPPRTRWFAGLRRSRSRVLGGVAAGFAEFWAVDPLLIRVLAASPLLAAMFAYVGQVILGLYWTVPVTQLLWLVAAVTIAAYLLGWILIPHPEGASLARRFLGWGGPFGTLAKLVVGFVVLIAVGWLGLVALALMGALDDIPPLLLRARHARRGRRRGDARGVAGPWWGPARRRAPTRARPGSGAPMPPHRRMG